MAENRDREPAHASSGVTRLIEDLAALVIVGESMLDDPSGDAALDLAFRREHARSKSILRALVGDETMRALGIAVEGKIHTCSGQPVGKIRAAQAACAACHTDEEARS